MDGISQFSIRGGILDLYALPKEPAPVRIEFWGDEIDTMSYFELDSQRRTDAVDRVDISPANEVVFSEGELSTRLREFCGKLRSKKSLLRGQKGPGKGPGPAGTPGWTWLRRTSTFPWPTIPSLPFSTTSTRLPCFSASAPRPGRPPRGLFWQYSEDLKVLFDEGQLCKGLDSYLSEPRAGRG